MSNKDTDDLPAADPPLTAERIIETRVARNATDEAVRALKLATQGIAHAVANNTEFFDVVSVRADWRASVALTRHMFSVLEERWTKLHGLIEMLLTKAEPEQ